MDPRDPAAPTPATAAPTASDERPASSPSVPAERPEDRTRDRARGAGARRLVARVVRIGCGLLATVLALGALLVVLRDHLDEQNGAVRLVLDVADAVSGPFSRSHGLVDLSGRDAAAKNALVGWGAAAVLYLLVGRLLAAAIRPRGSRRPHGQGSSGPAEAVEPV